MRRLSPDPRPLIGLTALLALVVAGPAAGHAVSGPDRSSVAAAVEPALPGSGPQQVAVIVQKDAHAGRAPEAAVERVGGRVTQDLPLVHGFAATLPGDAVRTLAATSGVRVLSQDRPVQVQGEMTTGSGASVHLREIRSDELQAAGATGRGVTVALIDTGVAEVDDLGGRLVPVRDEAGEVSSCHNLSGEPGCGDSYGHGTFMAGLIAGSGAASDGRHGGAAPGASILSVKVAGRTGAADVSTVLAAIQWVVSFKDTYDVRVLNLSLGTDSTLSYREDPLNYAVQRAWDAGITVVVSAANAGPAAGTVRKPGDDPWVITVGAVDDRRTPAVADDRLPDFSSRGPTADGVTKPDVVAPGAHLASLRAPGSHIEEAFPSDGGGAYRTGSGTSMAAGVVSGAVAQLLQAHPTLTPDQVKAALRATARPVASDDPNAIGAGLVDVRAAAEQAPLGTANEGLDRSSGLGALDASRGMASVRLDDPLSTVLTGRQTAQLVLWDPVGFSTGAWTPTTWYTSAHGSLGWNAASWEGHNWGGHNWGGATWYGEPSDDSYGAPTDGSAWYGAWD